MFLDDRVDRLRDPARRARSAALARLSSDNVAHRGIGDQPGGGEVTRDRAAKAASCYQCELGPSSDDATVGAKHLAIDPAAVGRDEEGDRARDVFRAQAAEATSGLISSSPLSVERSRPAQER